ncbi:MAG: HAD-IIIC family phosphatase [Deltaproteobacteria bacterium]|nr:HAD-IIIC family phosphatase [Deltaproteobacteria bacterium]
MLKTLEEIAAEIDTYQFNDYLRHLNIVDEAALTGLAPLRIAVLRSYTAELLEPVLKLRLMAAGYKPEMSFGGFGGYAQEILDEQSALYAFKPNVVLLLTRLEELMPDFIDGFGDKTSKEWEEAVDTAANTLAQLVDTAGKRMPCRMIVQNMSLTDPYFGIHDAQQESGQRYLVDRFNKALASRLGSMKNAFIWEFDGLIRRKGWETFLDAKLWYTSRSPYKQSAYLHIGADIATHILSASGRVKKCIVLDLDNTLWGGIAGEDGIDGVKLGHDYPGSCYRDFQKGLLRLVNRGLILAVNSKNNEQDALEIIEKHPYMTLRKHHFAAMRINWNDKVSNMRELASEINIGLESMIFIDDSEPECALVAERCPEVSVVHLPNKPYLIPGALNALPYVENITLTDEDRKKSGMYKAQIERKEFERSVANLDDFLAGLCIEATIEPANGFSISRIAQLTQKTNQLNLTTRRYAEAQVQSFMDSADSCVYSVASKDRFGDNGIVGVFILRFAGDDCLIDSFLLSCRVIGRNIESAMMAIIAAEARARKAETITGEYLPTPKNKPASDMYAKLGFSKINDTHFKASLDALPFDCPPYIKLTCRA